MLSRWGVWCVSVALAGACGLSEGLADDRAVVESLRSAVRHLASDELEGRGIGTQGLHAAGDWIAAEFAAAGLDVTIAGGDPFQNFGISDGVKLESPNSLLLHGPGYAAAPLEMEKTFQPCAFGGAGEFSAPIVFAGYGIDAPEVGYNDFQSVDVSGKVVLLLRRHPRQSDPHGPFAVAHGVSRHAALNTKVSQAYQRGAVAVLFVNDFANDRAQLEQLNEQVAAADQEVLKLEQQQPGNAEELHSARTHQDLVRRMRDNYAVDALMPFGYGGQRTGKSPPCLHISQSAANRMFQQVWKVSLEEIEREIDEDLQPRSRELTGWSATGVVSPKQILVEARNVIGVLPGDGPLAEETIVVGAHYDHLGRGGEGSLAPHSQEIHNGADDNASGVAALIELAQRLANRDNPLSRRIVFVAFSGEERGLLGSVAYVNQALLPVENTVAMFNMDMVGRLESGKLTVFGTGTSPRWNSLLEQHAPRQGLTISSKPEGFGPSDHSTFYAQKIPVLHLFTGAHDDYHRPSDDWEKLNYEGIAQVVSLLEELVVDTAQQTDRPEYQFVQGAATLERSGGRPYFGSIPDFSTDAAGYALQGVAPGSPADLAGLKKGDVIVQLGSQRIGGLDDFDLALRKHTPGELVEVTVLRDGREVKIKVTLATPRP